MTKALLTNNENDFKQGTPEMEEELYKLPKPLENKDSNKNP